MGFSIDTWLAAYLAKLEERFGGRLWFVGLQGSFARGEATESSDIDVVAILNRLSPEDVQAYSQLLDTLPERQRVCGFLSGRQELESWDRSDLFQFCWDTTPIQGSLETIKARITREDVRRAIHTGVCNLYHMCVHNMAHEKSGEILRGLYKSARFTLRAIAYWQTGAYFRRQEELMEHLQIGEQRILENALALGDMETLFPQVLEAFSREMLTWCSGWITEAGV